MLLYNKQLSRSTAEKKVNERKKAEKKNKMIIKKNQPKKKEIDEFVRKSIKASVSVVLVSLTLFVDDGLIFSLVNKLVHSFFMFDIL